MTTVTYNTYLKPPDMVTDPIEHGLHEYNLAVLGPEVIYNYDKIAITARNENGQIIGGMIGEFVWGWLHIATLWVAPEQRGRDIGTRLLQEMEQAARGREIHQATLKTTSFQARDFYLKNGFVVVGAIEGKPTGHTWYYMKKEF